MAQTVQKSLSAGELAERRLALMVTTYSLFIKNLKEEGVPLEQVKAASDRTWQKIGEQAGEMLKPLFEGAPISEMTQVTGNLAVEVHGMTANREMRAGAHRTNFEKCPWHDTAEALALPVEWRLCRSGHESFVRSMFQALDPRITTIMDDVAAQGALCSETIGYGAEASP